MVPCKVYLLLLCGMEMHDGHHSRTKLNIGPYAILKKSFSVTTESYKWKLA